MAAARTFWSVLKVCRSHFILFFPLRHIADGMPTMAKWRVRYINILIQLSSAPWSLDGLAFELHLQYTIICIYV